MNLRDRVVQQAALDIQHNHSLRWGQALFNALWTQSPLVADQIRTTKLDPFYDDDRAEVFLEYIKAWK